MKKAWIISLLCLALSIPLLAGDITGKVLFTGKPPKAVAVPLSSDPYCQSMHKEPVTLEVVSVNPNSTLKNVIVSVKEGLGAKMFPPPAQAAALNQNGCMFEPHVLPILVGQELQIMNSDSTLHNVHSMAKSNPGFNLAQPSKGLKLSRKLSSPEIFKIKCDVHPWMTSYVAVLSNPYYSVTGNDGTFTIKNLPAGNYTIEAWQEKLGTQTAKVTVGATGSSTLDFTFKGHP
jgi:plastocyanin